MGFFDFLTGGGPEKQRGRHVKKLTNKHSQIEDRELAMRWLAEDGTEESILGLLARFEMAIENRMKDTGEKEQVLALLEAVGVDAVEPAQRHIRVCKNFAYPLRVIERVAGEAVALATIRAMLAEELARNDFKPKRKTALLVKMADFVAEEIIESAAPFLEDFDEGVRYAAVEVLLGQDGDGSRAPLLAALVNEEEESNRLRARIADGFVHRGWTVSGAESALSERPPVGWTVKGDRLVPASD